MAARETMLGTLLLMALATPWSSGVLAEDATVLNFTEKKPTEPVRNTRAIVTQKFLRIDDGDDAGDFLLFDRARRVIYVTNSLDKRILVIKARAAELTPPTPFEQRVEKSQESYPNVAGRKVIHYRLFTNGEKCFDVYAAAGLLTDAQQALREYRMTLAGEQAVTAKFTPPEFQSACDLANNVFLPARHLEYGFPVRQQDLTGARRQLLDYKTGLDVAPSLFELPPGYRRFTLGDMRKRAP